jgi:hypothetical protein
MPLLFSSGKASKPNFVMPFAVLDALGLFRDKFWANGRLRFGRSMSLSPWISITGAVDGRGSYRLIGE